jgi:hypothetical protein
MKHRDKNMEKTQIDTFNGMKNSKINTADLKMIHRYCASSQQQITARPSISSHIAKLNGGVSISGRKSFPGMRRPLPSN